MKKLVEYFVFSAILQFILMIGGHQVSLAQSWLYLGQSPPGMVPERFPPDYLLSNNTWWWHTSAVFSPDGTEMFFSKYLTATGRMELGQMKYENNSWIGPLLPSFTDTLHSKNCPVFSPGGDSLYFVSTQPGEHIMLTTRVGGEWTTPSPVYIPYPPGSFQGYQFALAHDKSIYFEIWEDNQVDLYYSQYLDGSYQEPDVLTSLNTDYYDWGPYIDPDDEFIIFSSNRPGGYGLNDLYVSTRDNTGGWNVPVNAGPDLNSDHEDTYPLITFDKQYFFFTTWKTGDIGYNPYWVDSQIIFNIISDVEEESSIPNTGQKVILKQNYPNPFYSNTTIPFEVKEQDHITIRIVDMAGRQMAILVDEIISAGSHLVSFNRNDFDNGIYYYQLNAGKSMQSKKMLIIDGIN